MLPSCKGPYPTLVVDPMFTFSELSIVIAVASAEESIPVIPAEAKVLSPLRKVVEFFVPLALNSFIPTEPVLG